MFFIRKHFLRGFVVDVELKPNTNDMALLPNFIPLVDEIMADLNIEKVVLFNRETGEILLEERVFINEKGHLQQERKQFF